jgi:hypothetical protein
MPYTEAKELCFPKKKIDERERKDSSKCRKPVGYKFTLKKEYISVHKKNHV